MLNLNIKFDGDFFLAKNFQYLKVVISYSFIIISALIYHIMIINDVDHPIYSDRAISEKEIMNST